ncbi:hypothetical protein [Methylobacterium longum]|uniref:Uncharacterized protein n=1 Tax=Methylobacterium longum TaxID=767694 RepID=A0ABT8AVI6_9HYPH|nr:hypothetical protein [Methylobacterium longum]MDN3573969.1 hypothetical protein [Methylobacterium longum]GJE14756.1 hypothetical protein FOHLNKBM_5831 [Methylobacterium longum]
MSYPRGKRVGLGSESYTTLGFEPKSEGLQVLGDDVIWFCNAHGSIEGI